MLKQTPSRVKCHGIVEAIQWLTIVSGTSAAERKGDGEMDLVTHGDHATLLRAGKDGDAAQSRTWDDDA